MKVSLKSVVGLAAHLAFAASLYSQGSVGGILSDDTGKPLPSSARVMLLKVAESPEGFVPFVSSTITAKDGSFRIDDVPVGKYYLCVHINGLDYVDECRWGRPEAIATVSKGQVATANIKLVKGRVVILELKDEESLLTKHEGQSFGGFFDIGVANANRDLVPAVLESAANGRRRYRVVVPLNEKFRIRASSPLFDFQTETGQVTSLRVLEDIDQQVSTQDLERVYPIVVKGLKQINLAK